MRRPSRRDPEVVPRLRQAPRMPLARPPAQSLARGQPTSDTEAFWLSLPYPVAAVRRHLADHIRGAVRIFAGEKRITQQARAEVPLGFRTARKTAGPYLTGSHTAADEICGAVFGSLGEEVIVPPGLLCLKHPVREHGAWVLRALNQECPVSAGLRTGMGPKWQTKPDAAGLAELGAPLRRLPGTVIERRPLPVELVRLIHGSFRFVALSAVSRTPVRTARSDRRDSRQASSGG